MSFSEILLNWYYINKRDLPWRSTNNIYFIWVSEIILQQTRVEQGLSYYNKFIKNFPDIFSLANASEENVLKTWQGLGYYTRARNMHAAAKQIVEDHNGIIPASYNEIIKIRGIGKYTAAAILSFGYNLPYPVLDGNVKRVVSRYFAIKNDISLPETEIKLRKKLDALFDKNKPADFNQAIMEFGALYCKPGIPDCTNCIFKEKCKAFTEGKVMEIPFNPSKTKISQRFFYYVIPQCDKTKTTFTYLVKREKKDIWKNMFEFPLIELDHDSTIENFFKSSEFKKIFSGNSVKFISASQVIVHKLSHQLIRARYIHIKIQKEINYPGFIKVLNNEFKNYPVSRLIEKYLKDENLFNL